MRELFASFVNSFKTNKLRYVVAIVIISLLYANIILVPTMVSAYIGLFFADAIDEVHELGNYFVQNVNSIELSINYIFIVMLLISVAVVISINVSMVISDDKTYVLKTNAGMPRSEVIKEILFNSFILMFLSILIGFALAYILSLVWGIVVNMVIAVNMWKVFTSMITIIVVGLLASYITFLFGIDKARETKGITK